MNTLVLWRNNMKGPGFKRLLELLDVRFCAYIYGDENRPSEDDNIEWLPICQFEKLDFFKRDQEKMIPLDGAVMEAMLPYAQTAMDIINRWRRSYTTKESYHSVREIYLIMLRYWNDFLLRHHIDFVYFDVFPHIPITYTIYALCKIYGIPIVLQSYLPMIDSHRTNIFFVTGIESMTSEFLIRLEQNFQTYAGKSVPLIPEIDEYFENHQKASKDTKTVIAAKESYTAGTIIKKFIERGKLYLKQKQLRILLKKMRYVFTVHRKNQKVLSYCIQNESDIDYTKKFIFFALHYQPECTTLPCGGVFVDQLEAIRMISAALPEDYYLYVKEHPALWDMEGHWETNSEVRSREFYESFASMRNVRLIKHATNSIEIIEHAAAIATISGTVGFEALFKHKPVLTFAHSFYTYFSGVYRIRSNDDCKKALQEIIRGEVSIDEHALRVYMKTFEPEIVHLHLNPTSFSDGGRERLEEEDLIQFSERIAQFYFTSMREQGRRHM